MRASGNTECKHASSPVRKKFKSQVLAGKFMLTVFWDLEAEDPGFCDYVKVKHILKRTTGIFVKLMISIHKPTCLVNY